MPPPKAEPVRDLDAEQRKLTQALMGHEDPHVRLLAHISERQLAFVEMLGEFRQGLNANTAAVASMADSLKLLAGRQDAQEQRYPLNGQSDHADAQ